MQIKPEHPIGYRTNTMVVVICPTCGKKRWANIMYGDQSKGKKARTTCCATVVEITWGV